MNEECEMLGTFDAEKAREAAGVLFEALGVTSMDRMKLLKLLYIADRENVRDAAASITGDRTVAMDWGPVLSNTYDCIKGQGTDARCWKDSFENEGPRQVRLVAPPGTDHLSRPEIAKLREVAARFGQMSSNALSRLTHDFAEWEKNRPPQGSANEIPAADLLEAVGWGDEAGEILAEAAYYRRFDARMDDAERYAANRIR